MNTITPFLWFESGAKEAAEYYVSVFKKDSRITAEQVLTDTPSGTVEVISVTLRGQPFTMMSAGPFQKINSAVSFVVDCADQEEVDYYWGLLSAVPEAEQCGWCTDKYGVTWQIVPSRLNELMSDPDKAKAMRVQKAMLSMKKISIVDIEKAAA